MIFAAGFGTRMRPLTNERPKPLIEVGNTTLLDHAIDLTRGAGIGRIVVNTHYLSDMIRTHLDGQNVLISDETGSILETGGGLKAALPLLQSDAVFTINSDAVWKGPNPFDVLKEAWDSSRMGALLLVVPPDAALGHAGSGDFDLGPDGQISRGTETIYSGAQIIRADKVQDIEEDAFSLNRVWNQFAETAELFGVVYPGRWCDVGRPECIPLAETLLTDDV